MHHRLQFLLSCFYRNQCFSTTSVTKGKLWSFKEQSSQRTLLKTMEQLYNFIYQMLYSGSEQVQSCWQRVGDSRWWCSLTLVSVRKYHNHTTKSIHHHHHHHHHHYHHHHQEKILWITCVGLFSDYMI